MPADQAHPQMYPSRSDPDAVLADMLCRQRDAYQVEMRAFGGHLGSFESGLWPWRDRGASPHDAGKAPGMAMRRTANAPGRLSWRRAAALDSLLTLRARTPT